MNNFHIIGSISTVIMGISPRGSTYNDGGVGLPLLNGPTEFGAFHPNCTLFTTDSKRQCKEGDLLFCVRGSTTGRMNWADQTYSLGRGVCSIRGMTILDTKYIKYCLEYRLPALLKLAGGGTFPNLTKEDICGFDIPYSFDRHKIASIISKYDELIENNSRRIKILYEIAQAIYREWFIHYCFPGNESGRMVDSHSELGMLPDGWEIKSIGKLLVYHINGGWGEEEQSEKYPIPAFVIRGTDIPLGRFGQFDEVPYRFHKESNFESRQIHNGDIVIEIAGGSKGQPVGRAFLASQHMLETFGGQLMCASFCMLLRPNRLIVSSEYIYLHLLEIYENGVIEKYQTQSTGIINFKSTYFLENHILPVPNKKTMISFTEAVHPLFDLIGNLGLENSNLRKTRELLLPKLISGELDISDVDIPVDSTSL